MSHTPLDLGWVALLVSLSVACASESRQSCSNCALPLANDAGAAGAAGSAILGTIGGALVTGVGGVTNTGGALATSIGGALATSTGGVLATSIGGALATSTGGAHGTGVGGVTNTGGARVTGVGGVTNTGGAVATNSGGALGNAGSGLAVAGATSSYAWPPSCTNVTGAVAKDLVQAGALLLDVREPSEFAAGALPGAVNIPRGSLATRLTELDKNRPIVVYCQSGSRASLALTELCNAGYKAYSLGARSNWPN